MKINVLKKLSLTVMIVLFVVLFALSNFGFGGYDLPIITVTNIILSVLFLAALFLTAFLQSRKNTFIITYTVLFAIAVISTVVTEIAFPRGLNMYLREGLSLLARAYYVPISTLMQLIDERLRFVAHNTYIAITIIASFLVVYLIALVLHFVGKRVLPPEPQAEANARRPLWYKALKITSPFLLLGVQFTLFIFTGFGLIDYYNSALKIILSIAFILLLMLTAYLYSNKNTFVIIYSACFAFTMIMMLLPMIIELDSAILFFVLGMTYSASFFPITIPIAEGLELSKSSEMVVFITISVVVYLAMVAVHFISRKIAKKKLAIENENQINTEN